MQTSLCLSFSCPGLACHQAFGRRGAATLEEEVPQAACRAGGLSANPEEKTEPVTFNKRGELAGLSVPLTASSQHRAEFTVPWPSLLLPHTVSTLNYRWPYLKVDCFIRLIVLSRLGDIYDCGCGMADTHTPEPLAPSSPSALCWEEVDPGWEEMCDLRHLAISPKPSASFHDLL